MVQSTVGLDSATLLTPLFEERSEFEDRGRGSALPVRTFENVGEHFGGGGGRKHPIMSGESKGST